MTMRLLEGKKREIRRIWAHFGFAVPKLQRVGYGPFLLGDLRPGEVERVDECEVDELLRRFRLASSLRSPALSEGT